MNLTQATAALADHRTSFAETVKEPNTLERNIILAGHRADISRLEKLISTIENPKTRAKSTIKLVR